MSAANWLVHWIGVTLVAAIAATSMDAVLLQRRRSYFTGGFLSTEHITHPGQAIAFVVGSIVTDAAVAGVIVAIVLWFLSSLGLSRRAAAVLAIVLALAPVVVANVIAYQLATFLGDAFDLRLMFDLAGRSPAEIFAVSSTQVSTLIGAAAAASVILGATVLVLRRRAVRAGAAAESPRLLRALAGPACVLVVGLITTAGLRSSSDVLDNGLRRKPTGQLLGAILSISTDVDGDGYGLFDRPPDPAPFDAALRPWARDIPGNGIDEDGVGGDLPAGPPIYVEPNYSQTEWRAKPDVVMIGLESFRADVVGRTLQGRSVTPVLDSLAARGVRSTAAYSHNGYTVQSRRHIFSGRLADFGSRDTLIDDFKAHGYETAYFSGQDESYGGSAGEVGFERADVAVDARADVSRRYSTFTTAGSLAVPYDVVLERTTSFLRSRGRERPLFLYVNFHDTHFPYHHRTIRPVFDTPVLSQAEIRPERADDVARMYANTAANVDRAVGELLDAARLALGREPGVIILADHGESLFDAGFLGHGYALNDAQTQIPLIVANLPVTIDEPFGQADLRGLVLRALAEADSNRAPLLRRDSERRVFQYLGVIDRPAQIALTGLNGRVIYDFRTARAQVGEGEWRRPEELDAASLTVFLELVRLWESIMVSKPAPTSAAAMLK